MLVSLQTLYPVRENARGGLMYISNDYYFPNSLY